MSTATPIHALLRAAARVDLDDDDRRRLRAAAAGLPTWREVASAAEAHGLSALLLSHLDRLESDVTRLDLDVPVDARQQLFGLAMRHRRLNAACFAALAEVLETFTRHGIRVVVLKGGALAHMLYATPSLRPLSDVDLLVDPADAAGGQAALARLGFAAPRTATSRRLVAHHHLPAATRLDDGQLVRFELHTNACSRDAPGSMTLRDLLGRTRRFSLGGGVEAEAPGHIEMLYHLTRHAAERSAVLRLIWVADIVGYAFRFADEIAWDEVRERYPFVLNALGLLHLVTPLPPRLRPHVDLHAEPMEGVGLACRPLTDSVRRDRSVADIARDVFLPPEWWMRFYYGIGPARSLWWHRTVRHPASVGWWFTRRAVAYSRWAMSGRSGAATP